MTQASYALRLRASLKAEAERVTKRKGTTLNNPLSSTTDQDEAPLRFLVPRSGVRFTGS